MLPELWSMVFVCLSTRESRRCSTVCSLFRKVVQSKSSYASLLLANRADEALLDIITQVPYLRQLELVGPRTHIAYSLAPVLNLLRTIDLNYGVTDAEIISFRGLPVLETIILRNCSLLTDAALHVLAYSCPGLINVSFYNFEKLTNRGIRAVADMSTLRSFFLGYCYRLTDRVFRGFRHKLLESLVLNCCYRLTDFDFLRQFPALTYLKITNSKVEHLNEPLAALGELRQLHLTYCNRLEQLRLTHPHLLVLDTNGSVLLRSVELHTPVLRRIDFSLTSIGDDVLRQLPQSVVKLYLRKCYQLTDLGLTSLQRLFGLQYLNIRSCPGVSDRGLAWVMRHPVLRTFNAQNCPSVTKQQDYHRHFRLW